jgi:probable phosphoglycerate mutase
VGQDAGVSRETRVVVLRHGESNAQVAHMLSGHDTCTGLSDRGRAQAGALTARLVRTGELGPVDVVYTSVLPRARETAAIVAPALGGAPVLAECEWCEIHSGDAEGMDYDEMRAKYLPGVRYAGPYDRPIPNGESWADLYTRVGTRLQRAARDHAGATIVVAGHGGTVGASFVAFGHLPMPQATDLVHNVHNTSITEWVGTDGHWRLARFNDAAHLHDL